MSCVILTKHKMYKINKEIEELLKEFKGKTL